MIENLKNYMSIWLATMSIIIFFTTCKSIAFETAALKASILNCYGFFLEKDKILENNEEFKNLMNTIRKLKKISIFNSLNKKKYIDEGKIKAKKTNSDENIYYIFLGCKKDVNALRKIFLN